MGLHAIPSSLQSLLYQRQTQREQAAFLKFTSHLNHTAVRIDNGFRNRKPKPSAPMRTRAGLVRPPKPLENVRQLFDGNAGATISNGQNSRTIFLLRGDPYLTALAVVMNRIG